MPSTHLIHKVISISASHDIILSQTVNSRNEGTLLFSLGHSTLSIEAFLKVAAPINVVMDVRSHPVSRWPQFCKDEMEKWLQPNWKYEWEPRLGGWDIRHASLLEELIKVDVDLGPYLKGKFPKQRIAQERQIYPLLEGEVKPTWYNRGLYDYSWFMIQPEFLDAVTTLIERGKTENIGIMCCESLWWKCHRSMIADYIIWRGSDIEHLQPKRILHSKVISNRLQRYDEKILKIWDSYAGVVKLADTTDLKSVGR